MKDIESRDQKGYTKDDSIRIIISEMNGQYNISVCGYKTKEEAEKDLENISGGEEKIICFIDFDIHKWANESDDPEIIEGFGVIKSLLSLKGPLCAFEKILGTIINQAIRPIEDRKVKLKIQEIMEEWEKNEGKRVKELEEERKECEIIVRKGNPHYSLDVGDIIEEKRKRIKSIYDIVGSLIHNYHCRIDRAKDLMCEHEWVCKRDVHSRYKECTRCGLVETTEDYELDYES